MHRVATKEEASPAALPSLELGGYKLQKEEGRMAALTQLREEAEKNSTQREYAELRTLIMLYGAGYDVDVSRMQELYQMITEPGEHPHAETSPNETHETHVEDKAPVEETVAEKEEDKPEETPAPNATPLGGRRRTSPTFTAEIRSTEAAPVVPEATDDMYEVESNKTLWDTFRDMAEKEGLGISDDAIAHYIEMLKTDPKELEKIAANENEISKLKEALA